MWVIVPSPGCCPGFAWLGDVAGFCPLVLMVTGWGLVLLDVRGLIDFLLRPRKLEWM